MPFKSNSDSKHARKRTDLEIARDRALIAELHYKGYSDKEITDQVNNRPGIGYQLSTQSINRDRSELLKQLHEEGLENTGVWLQEEIFRLTVIEKEAWNAWQESATDVTSKKINKVLREYYEGEGKDRKVVDSEMVVKSIEEFIMSRPKEPKWLQIILDCVEKRARLRGLYKFQARIEIDQEIRTKTYSIWSPTNWDNAIDGVVETVKGIADGKNGRS